MTRKLTGTPNSNFKFGKKWLTLIAFTFLFSVEPLWAAPIESLSSLDFTADTGNWTAQKANVVKEDVQNGAVSFARLEAKATESARLSSPIWKIDGEKFVEIQFRYRSNVPQSSRDVGSWFYIPFMDSKGQGVNSEAIILPSASGWTEVKKPFAIPIGATQWQTQLRLQNTGGQLDIDDVVVRYVSKLQMTAQSEEPSVSEWKELAQWSLKREGTKASLQGTSVLPAVPVSDDSKALAFMLPDQYCDRTDLIYDLTVEFVPNWKVGETKKAYGLFGLGRNMHGYAPPALSMMVWDGSQLFSRVTAQDNGRAQVITSPNDLRMGQTYRVRTTLTADTITAFGNHKRVGQNTMVGQFKWPRGKKFFVGTEDANESPLDGEIKEFTLRIWQPQTRVEWVGGAEAGYFFGEQNPLMSLAFPDANGLDRSTNFSIVDVDEKQVFQGEATSRSAGKHALKIPALPYGWYRLDAKVTEKNAPIQPELKTSRSFVLLPPITEREPANSSSFGITEEIALKEGRYDPVVFERLMQRSSQMGVRWWRLWVQWDAIEPERGQFQWKALDTSIAIAKKYGVETYLCLHGGANPWQAYGGGEKPAWGLMGPHVYAPRQIEDWNKYVRAIGTHLKGKVHYWQVWNEPDARNGFFPYSTEKYVEVLRHSSRILREVDSENIIGTGGFAAAFAMPHRDHLTHTEANSAWGLAEFYALMPQNDFEILDNHYYSVNDPAQSWDRHVQTVNELNVWLANRNIKTRLWNSETSMYSAPGKLAGTRGGWANIPYLSEKEQAQRLIEVHVQSLAVGIEKTFWYGVRGDIGVIESDLTPKPAFAAHAILAAKLRGLQFDSVIDLGLPTRAYTFRSQQGKPRYLTVLWERNGQRELHLSTKPTRVSDWMGNVRESIAEGTSLIVDSLPLYIESTQPLALRGK